MKHHLAPTSILHAQCAHYSYKDSVQIELHRSDISNQELIAVFFAASSGWINQLAKFRNQLVRQFGLKTGTPPVNTPLYLEGQEIGFFRLLQLNNNEIILGNDDKHLNFRTSLLLMHHDNRSYFHLSTAVLTKNCWGKIYFGFVQYVHQWIVMVMIKKIAAIIHAKTLAHLSP